MFTDGGDDFYGVIRIDVMRRIAPHNSYHNAGRKLAAELSLYGRFQQVPEVMSGDASTPAVVTTWAASSGSVPTWTRAGGAIQQHALLAEMVAAYPIAINRAPLSAVERLRCYQVYLKWIEARTVLKPLSHNG